MGAVAPPHADGPRDPPGPGTVLGLDEAGRGSVLGPLVVGGFLAPSASIDRLRDAGVRDSKLLTPRRRQEVYARLAGLGRRVSLALPVAAVDAAVAQGRLNDLELDGFARLIRRVRPDRVAVDACDVDARRFGRRLAERAGFSGPLDARHRADRDLAVVGAASIVAKVRRDAAVARIERSAGRAVGSGYPSDPTTIGYLRFALGTVGVSPPPTVRRSWATTARVIRERATVPLERFGT